RAGPELPARGGVAIGRLGSDRTALCTKPAPLPREGRTTWLAEIHRHEELLVLALDEERRGLPGLRHVRAQVLGRLERVAVDRQQHVARLDAGAARGPRRRSPRASRPSTAWCRPRASSASGRATPRPAPACPRAPRPRAPAG